MNQNTLVFILLWISLCVVSVFLSIFRPIYELNENQILYLFSSASQVIAAIYGLTITGYIFFRNELDRKANEDESYNEIISYLKEGYYLIVIKISVVTALSILLCFLSISLETYIIYTYTNIINNVTISTIIIELILIITFVIKILDPKSLEKASDEIRKQSKVSLGGVNGNLEEFLINYNEIEKILEKYGNEYVPIKFSEIYNNKVKTVSKAKLVNILLKAEKIDKSFRDELINIISYRNSVIHGTDLSVSSEAVEEIRMLLNKLKLALNVR